MFLETINLSKQYSRRDTVVDAIKNVSLQIEEGSFVTITGASGSGKTTLLLALSGLIRPTSGDIIINGKHIEKANDSELSKFRKENVGFILQSFSLIPYLTALQNVMVPLSLINHSKAKQTELAKSMMELVGLGDRLNHLPRELSAGQQQRVAIARAVVNKPKIIFADEPTGNLDSALSTEILDFMKGINNDMEITILLVTHSPVAADFGNLKIKLSNGELINAALVKKMKILILCTGNSCRSQMAEAFLKSFNKNIEVYSAGTNPTGSVNPYAFKVMQEIGIDISKNKTKNINEFLSQEFDYVITVCDDSKETCPLFTVNVKHRMHIGFEDPADAKGTENEIMEVFRKVRNQIKEEFTKFNNNL